MKKETKTVKKTAKKVTKKKPTFIVDLTKAETPEDVKFEFIRAKATSGVKVTEDEIKFLVMAGATLMMDMIDSYIATEYNKSVVCTDKKVVSDIIKYIEKKIVKKDSWYKRAWKWIKHPFKKK